MSDNQSFSRTDAVDISDLQNNFLSLRIGEEIPVSQGGSAHRSP